MLRLLLPLPAAPCRAAPDATDWPAWRGPTGEGKVGGPVWPERLVGGRLRRIWRIEMGPSYSGPVVAGGVVHVTETQDEAVEVVHALRRESGEEVRKTS